MPQPVEFSKGEFCKIHLRRFAGRVYEIEFFLNLWLRKHTSTSPFFQERVKRNKDESRD